ncbi:PUS5 21S rRNA pseudouridine(2819) synthase [Candida maltosa Xu316]
MVCDEFHTNNLSNAITTQFEKRLPSSKPSHYLPVTRLNRFVTGGVFIARNKRWEQKVRQSFYSDDIFKLTIRYVGLIPLHTIPDKTEGTFDYDISALVRDYRFHETKYAKKTVSRFPALTYYKLLPHLTRTFDSKYPIFEDKPLVPAIFEMRSGKKNQLRNHVLQKFGVPLLNDDKIKEFMFITRSEPGINSTKFKSNQIGLHSALMVIENVGVTEDLLIPVAEPYDRELWGSFLDKDGNFIKEIQDELINFYK